MTDAVANATAAATADVNAAAAESHQGPPLERQVFDSWEQFDRFIETYARRTFQLFRKRTSTSVKLRNRRLTERARNRQRLRAEDAADSLPLIPEHYVNYSLTLVCTHSGAFVSRGTGRRSRQDVRATHCGVQVNACLKLADPKCNRYVVQVTRAALTHNHRVDKETFLQYSNTRLNLPDELLGCIELMRKTGMKARDVRAYIMENSTCVPTLKDVQNMLQRLRNQDETALVAAAAAAATTADTQQLQASDPQVGGLSQTAPPVGIIQDEVLRDYGHTAAVADKDATPEPIDPTTQFKVAHAMGKAVASLLAEVPATEFASAFRVIELARGIVRERAVSAGSRAMATSEEDQSEAAVSLDGGLGVSNASASTVPLDERWP